MAETPRIFNLERFEYLVNNKAHEEACNELLYLLSEVDNYYGQWGDHVTANTKGLTGDHINQRICTRLAGAV
ncbi:MAG: cobalt ABC transporter permease, partial [Enterobacteriaceae bacterium]